MVDINLEQLAKTVGRAIVRRRQQTGLTQKQVEEHLNIGMSGLRVEPRLR